MFRHYNLDLHQQIPKLILFRIDRHSKSAKSELFAVRRSLRNIDSDFTLQCFDLSLSAEKSRVEFNREFTVKIISVPLKFRMRCNFDGEIKVAVWTAASSDSPLPGYPQNLIVCNTLLD